MVTADPQTVASVSTAASFARATEEDRIATFYFIPSLAGIDLCPPQKTNG